MSMRTIFHRRTHGGRRHAKTVRSMTAGTHRYHAAASVGLLVMTGPTAVADVISVSASGSIGYSGQLAGEEDTADYDASLGFTWDGSGSLDQSASDEASIDGTTVNARSRIELSSAISGGVTTVSYRESYTTSTTGPSDPLDYGGWSRSQTVQVTFTTTDWTRLDFTGLEGGLLAQNAIQFYSVDQFGEIHSIDLSGTSPIVDWSSSMGTPLESVLDAWDGVDSALLLGAGTWTLELNDSIGASGAFDDFLTFEMNFSAFTVPGPASLGGLMGLLLFNSRRRR